ncbi:MAG TPA: phosphate signaling complex protein PhoU [Anaerolineaceae bacterium]|nr:phosphate signaling complex protein PhoU [Anaerolineaceae bacterium]
MMRAKYFKELEELKTEVILYGSYIEGMCRTLQKAFVEGDYEEAKLMVDEESTIRSKERRIENDCLRIMSTQQPVAKDLRFISSVLKIANNLQRIGGHVIEIVELLDFVGPINNLFAVNQLIDMNSRVMVMLKKALDSFVENDLELAEEVIASDNEVDALFDKTMDEIADRIRTDTDSYKYLIDAMQITKYLERIGDNTERIARWVIFAIKGDPEQQEQQ